MKTVPVKGSAGLIGKAYEIRFVADGLKDPGIARDLWKWFWGRNASFHEGALGINPR